MKLRGEFVGNKDFRGRRRRMREGNGVKMTAVHYINVKVFQKH